jgi:hypothetical protein
MSVLSRFCLWILVVWLAGMAQAVAAGLFEGKVRGVTFFYLDGAKQDFPWVLEHQREPLVRARIENLLKQYRAAGVNWIRLLIATDHFSDRSVIHPVPTQPLIQKVNDFMAITRNGPNAGQFTLELVLLPEQKNARFTDTAPYERDKRWYKTWLDHLDYTNLGMVMFGGDLSPRLLSGGQDETGAEPIPQNHGAWIKSIWAWKKANYPDIYASYEVIGIQTGSRNNPLLIQNLATWAKANTPGISVFSAALYVELPSGRSWRDYADVTATILDTYHSVSDIPLWIDEFGKSSGTTWTLEDQKNAYTGFLTATVSWRRKRYPMFAWVTGNDAPYDGKNTFGLVSGFEEAKPLMRPAWEELTRFYQFGRAR